MQFSVIAGGDTWQRTRGSGHAARDAGVCRSLLHGGARLRADDRGGGVAEQAVGRGGEVSSTALNEGQHEGGQL